jgi:hypothetical protein
MAKASGKARYEKIWQDSKGNLRDAWGRFLKGWQEIEGYKEEENYQSKIEQSDRQIQRGELKNLLTRNVCEIVFVRRRPERAPGRPEVRRMLCTICREVQKSERGIRSLSFREPKTSRRLDEVKHDIVVVWDIIQQDYRNVSMDACFLRQTIPGDETFWKYYDKVFSPMSPQQRQHWMDSMT